MKNSLPILFAAVILCLSSCTQTQQLSDATLIQKRKYTKGYNLNLKSPWKSDANVAATASSERATYQRIKPLKPSASPIASSQVLPTELQVIPIDIETIPVAPPTTSSASVEMTRAEKLAFKKEVKNHFAENREAYKALEEHSKAVTSDFALPLAPMVQGGDPPLILMLIACIIPPLPMAILYGFGWQFWVSLLLCLLFGLELFYLGGIAFIFSLIMVILYYS